MSPVPQRLDSDCPPHHEIDLSNLYRRYRIPAKSFLPVFSITVGDANLALEKARGYRAKPRAASLLFLRHAARPVAAIIFASFSILAYASAFGVLILSTVALRGSLLAIVIMMWICIWASFFSRKATQCLLPDALTMLRLDNRPPIVWLRSFADENARVWHPRRWYHWLNLDPSGSAYIPRRSERLEEVLCSNFIEYGPFVSIGQPRERVPVIGSSRTYVHDRDWQRVATEFMRKSAMIVLVPGRSRGLEWEFETILRNGYLSKTLIILPASGSRERNNRLVTLDGLLQITDLRGLIPRCSRRDIIGIFFSSKNEPILLCSREFLVPHYRDATKIAMYGILCSNARHDSAPAPDRGR